MGDVEDWFEENITKPVKGWASDVAGGDSSFSSWGEDLYEGLTGKESKTTQTEKKEAGHQATAAADARVRQAEYEEQAARGAARTRAKRRRGFQSTVLTGGQTTLGTSLDDSGKTLLAD